MNPNGLIVISKLNGIQIAFLARIFFVNSNLIIEMLSQFNLTFEHFIMKWLEKSEWITSHYLRRINILSLLNSLSIWTLDIFRNQFFDFFKFAYPMIKSYKNAGPNLKNSLLTPNKTKGDFKKNKDLLISERKSNLQSQEEILKIDLVAKFALQLNLLMTSIISIQDLEFVLTNKYPGIEELKELLN